MTVDSKHTVLIVEDDDDCREVIRELLRDAGYVVIDTATPDEALVCLRESPDDCIVLLDYLLFQTSGAALLRAVEREPALCRHRYVLMTAMPLSHIPEEDQRLVETYCGEIVQKPFEVDRLLQAVEVAGAKSPEVPEISEIL